MVSKQMIQHYKELRRIEEAIDEISSELSEVARFSPELDAWWDEYAYAGYMDEFAKDNPQEAKKLIERGEKILEDYRNNNLRLKKVKISSRDVVQIRKKTTTKAKPKRKVVKKCKCK